LSLGEASGFLLLMGEARAARERRPVLATVSGWGITNDGYHMTSPSPAGEGLARAIEKALDRAGLRPGDMGSLSAHGTGTVFNDEMEMRAFKRVFGERPVPSYSIKGAVGHTLAAAGLVEILIALRALKEKRIPPTVNLSEVDPAAAGWISPEARPIRGPYTLSVNSGFGGINCALVLSNGGPGRD